MVKDGRKSINSRRKMNSVTKKQLEHEVKLSLVRHCRIWRYSVRFALEYCKSQGYPMGEASYHRLKQELNTTLLQGKEFTQQALANLQTVHGDSLELIDKGLDVAIKELRDLSSTPVYNVVEDKSTGIKTSVINKAHNSRTVFAALTKMTELLQARDETILATPVITSLVNELNKEVDG